MKEFKLNLLVLRVLNIKQSLHFYAALGIDFVLEQHGNGVPHYAGYAGAVLLEIYPAVPEYPATLAHLGFEVLSVEEAIKNLVHAGGRLVHEPRLTKWGFRATVADPNDCLVELSQFSAQTQVA